MKPRVQIDNLTWVEILYDTFMSQSANGITTDSTQSVRSADYIQAEIAA